MIQGIHASTHRSSCAVILSDHRSPTIPPIPTSGVPQNQQTPKLVVLFWVTLLRALMVHRVISKTSVCTVSTGDDRDDRERPRKTELVKSTEAYGHSKHVKSYSRCQVATTVIEGPLVLSMPCSRLHRCTGGHSGSFVESELVIPAKVS